MNMHILISIRCTKYRNKVKTHTILQLKGYIPLSAWYRVEMWTKFSSIIRSHSIGHMKCDLLRLENFVHNSVFMLAKEFHIWIANLFCVLTLYLHLVYFMLIKMCIYIHDATSWFVRNNKLMILFCFSNVSSTNIWVLSYLSVWTPRYIFWGDHCFLWQSSGF